MDTEQFLSKSFVVILLVFFDVYFGRRVLEGLQKGVLRVPLRGGDRAFSRKYHARAYWFWLCCMLGAVFITGPIVAWAMLFENAR